MTERVAKTDSVVTLKREFEECMKGRNVQGSGERVGWTGTNSIALLKIWHRHNGQNGLLLCCKIL